MYYLYCAAIGDNAYNSSNSLKEFGTLAELEDYINGEDMAGWLYTVISGKELTLKIEQVITKVRIEE